MTIAADEKPAAPCIRDGLPSVHQRGAGNITMTLRKTSLALVIMATMTAAPIILPAIAANASPTSDWWEAMAHAMDQ